MRFLDRFIELTAKGYAASLLLHVALIAVLSFAVVTTAKSEKPGVVLGMTDGDFDTDIGFDAVGDGRTDAPVAETEPFDLAAVSTSPPVSTLIPNAILAIEDALGAKAADSAAGAAGGVSGGHKYAMPAGGTVVTKGSFSVWTVPEDPAPGQQYSIVIQIKLPERVVRYRTDDLAGIVVGTDRYRQLIPGADVRELAVKGHSVQLEIPVPGASKLVEDTIHIRSRLLKESHEIKIVF